MLTLKRGAGVVVGACAIALGSAATAHAEPGIAVDGKGREYAAHSVVVKFERGASDATRAAAQRGLGVLAKLGSVRGIGAQVLAVRGDAAAAAARLRTRAGVAYAHPDYIMRSQAVPNDALFGTLWGLNNTGQTGGTPDADIDAPEGWDAFGLTGFPQTGGAKVGIVDTGIQQSHSEFAGKIANCAGVNNFGIALIIIIIGSDPTIVDGKCNDDNGHGSHVAGTVSANTNNASGVSGVAFNSPLAICKGLNSQGSGTLVMVANCIDYLNQRGSKVISMSLGGPGAAALQSAVQRATNNGSLLIAAAGNDGNSTLRYPAAYPEVVSVAATDHRDVRASFSNQNADVEIAGPGVNVNSTWNNGGYRTISGTSMATPHVAGVAALIADRFPSLGVAGWRSKLDAAVDDKGVPGRDAQYGFGRANLAKAAQ